MRVPIKVPRPAKRVMPYAHSVVAQDDELVMNFQFRELFPPAEFGRDPPGAIIVISFNEEDVLAADSFPISQGFLASSAAEVPKEI